MEEIQLGRLGCESTFLHNLALQGYELRNVGIDINCYHLHASNIRNYNPDLDCYANKNRMAFPILGPMPRQRTRKRDKILIDSAVISSGSSGAVRVWLKVLDRLVRSALAPRLVLLEQHPALKALRLPQRIVGRRSICSYRSQALK